MSAKTNVKASATAGGPLWTGEEAAQATGSRVVGATPAAIAGVSIDSRTIAPGELYVAIKGDAHDGHDFAAAALEKGAAAALISESERAALGDAAVSAAAVALAGGETGLLEILRAATAWSAAAVLMPGAGEISPRYTELAQKLIITEH